MKARLILSTCGLLILSFQTLTAQIAPMFEMPIYFEDAIGNKDTVIVGYDPDAIANGLNLQFGETWLDTPFDSVFEVRVSHSNEWPYRTGKKIIEHYDDSPPSDCGPSSWVEVMVHAKHFPIKISYDTAFINASACHRNMILSPDWQIFLQEFWWDAEVWYCMSNYDEIIDSSDYIVDPEGSAGYLKYEFEVEGQGLKELGGYFWVVKWIGVCQTLVGTEAGETEAAAVKIFPNPAADEISLELPKEANAERIDFYNAFGRKIKSLNARNSFDASKIQIGDLPVGFYIVAVTRSDGQLPLVFKFVKQRE